MVSLLCGGCSSYIVGATLPHYHFCSCAVCNSLHFVKVQISMNPIQPLRCVWRAFSGHIRSQPQGLAYAYGVAAGTQWAVVSI